MSAREVSYEAGHIRNKGGCGDIKRLSLPFIDTESLKNIRLSGGKFDVIDFSADGMVKITDMLEAGYALKDNKGTLSGKAGELVSYDMTAYSATYFADLEVVACEHSAANEAKGYCKYCGKIYAGKIIDKDGAVRYAEELKRSDFADENNIVP